MDNKKGGLDVAYNIQATVDSKNALVVDQYVINAPTDQGELSCASARAQKILATKNLTVLADKGYYNGEDLDKSFSLGVTPIVARQNPPVRKGTYSINDFVYDEANDSFICPQNKVLNKISSAEAKTTVYANKKACRECPYKLNCFKQGGKNNYRSIHKDKYFKTMLKADTLFENAKELYHTRQELSEHVFGSIKRQLGFSQLNVRTKPKVEGEVSLLFLGYNLKRVINIVGNTELIRYFRERTNSVLSKIITIFLNFYKIKSKKSNVVSQIAIYSTV